MASSSSSSSKSPPSADVTGELNKLGVIIDTLFARLEAAFEQQVRFTADASHELRTPLSIIQSHTELALSRPSRSEQEYREALEACSRAARRERALVDRLLTPAGADAGVLDLEPQRRDLHGMAEESEPPYAPMAG